MTISYSSLGALLLGLLFSWSASAQEPSTDDRPSSASFPDATDTSEQSADDAAKGSGKRAEQEPAPKLGPAAKDGSSTNEQPVTKGSSPAPESESPKGQNLQAGDAAGSKPGTTPLADGDGAFDAQDVSRRALRKHQLGENGTAVGLLLDGIEACRAHECSSGDLAVLHRDLGIVYSGGFGRHDDAVRAFEEAKSLNPEVSIPSLLATEPVTRAFEAATVPPPDEPAPAAAASEEDWGNASAPPRRNKYRPGLVLGLFDATARFGFLTAPRGAFSGIGHLGVAASALVHPGASPFVLGGRVNVALHAGELESIHYSAAGLLGGVFRGQRNIGYILGGVGAGGLTRTEFNASLAGAVFKVLGGASFGGFDFGGGFDIGRFEQDATHFTFGIHLGYGGYLNDSP